MIHKYFLNIPVILDDSQTIQMILKWFLLILDYLNCFLNDFQWFTNNS